MHGRGVLPLGSLVALLVPCAAPAGAGAKELRYADLLRELVNLDGLPHVEDGVRCAQFSSYDRRSRYDAGTGKYIDWGANADAGHYLRVDERTGEGIMADIEGPGCIFRIWSANPQGRIRFSIDGAKEPLEFDFNALFTGKVEPFRRPLVWQRRVVLGGKNPASDCYLPIPFAKRCIVAADKPHGQYYHIGYKTYPRDWKVPSFRIPLSKGDETVLGEVCRIWSQCGRDPHPKDAVEERAAFRLEGKSRGTLWTIRGPAVIQSFRARLTSKDPLAVRKARLTFHWDGEGVPSVDAPFGDFFGAGFGMVPFQSLPLGVADGEGYCFFRMPFRSFADLVLRNEGDRPVEIAAKIRYIRPASLPPDTASFHAKWRREFPARIFDYPMLECWGKGRFVGVVLMIDNILGGWWGEGDEKVYVDGERFPSTFGTGSEDYFGDAWGIRHFVNPLHGCPNTTGRKQVCYRWHIPDSIPFSRSFRITIENYSALREVKNGYASMAYWYAVEPARDFFRPVPVEDRIPTPTHIVPGALEAERLMVPWPERASIVQNEALSYRRGVRLAGENRILFRLTRGIPTEGDSKVVIDYVRIAPWRNFVRRWRVAGPFPNEEGR